MRPSPEPGPSSFHLGSLSHSSLRCSTFSRRPRPPRAEANGPSRSIVRADVLALSTRVVLHAEPEVAHVAHTPETRLALVTVPSLPRPISPRRPVPASHPATGVRRPRRRPRRFTGSEVKDADTIERMRVAGRLAAQARELVGSARRARASRPTSWTGSGTSSSATTAPTRRRSATAASPSRCAPASTRWSATASPTARVVEDGDIVNIDITAYLDGVHGDTNATFLAGDVDEETRLLVERTREALDRGDQGGPARPSHQRDRPGHRVLRRALRVRRRARVHRPRHRHVVPLAAWSCRTTTTPRLRRRDRGRA